MAQCFILDASDHMSKQYGKFLISCSNRYPNLCNNNCFATFIIMCSYVIYGFGAGNIYFI